MAKITPCLWFDGQAEEAAAFYVSLLPDSHVVKVWRSPADTPSGPAGMVLRRMNELLDDPDTDRARRAMEAMLQMVKLDVAELERAADGQTVAIPQR